MISLFRKMPYFFAAIVLFLITIGSAFACSPTVQKQIKTQHKQAMDLCQKLDVARAVGAKAGQKAMEQTLDKTDDAQSGLVQGASGIGGFGGTFLGANKELSQKQVQVLEKIQGNLEKIAASDQTCKAPAEQAIQSIDGCKAKAGKEAASSQAGGQELMGILGGLAKAASGLAQAAGAAGGGDAGAGVPVSDPGSYGYGNDFASNPDPYDVAGLQPNITDGTNTGDTSLIGTEGYPFAVGGAYDPVTGGYSDGELPGDVVADAESDILDALGAAGSAGGTSGGRGVASGSGGFGGSAGAAPTEDTSGASQMGDNPAEKGLAYSGASGKSVLGGGSGAGSAADELAPLNFDDLDDGEMPLADVANEIEDPTQISFDQPVDIAGYNTKFASESVVPFLFIDVKARIRETRSSGNL